MRDTTDVVVPARPSARARPLLRRHVRPGRRRHRRGTGGPGDWSRTPWWDRAAILLRAAELVSGKYRNELLATTMLGQSKTFHQAEIDAACELADFFRYNAHFAEQIYSTQPASPPGEFNYLDHRGLEGFVLAITPFNFTAIGGNLPTIPALMGNTVVWKPSEKSALAHRGRHAGARGGRLPPGVINKVHGSGADIAAQAIAARAVRRTELHRLDRGVPRAVGEDRRQHRHYRSYPRIVGETGGKNAVVAHPSADPRHCSSRWSAVRSSTRARSAPPPPAPTSRAACGRSWRPGSPTPSASSWSATRPATRPSWARSSTRLRCGAWSPTIDHGQGAARSPHPHRGHVRPDTGWFVDPTVFVTEDPRRS